MDILRAGDRAIAADGGLAGLIEPLDSESFLRERLGRKPFVVRGSAGRFGDLLGWEDLNAILGSTRVDLGRMHLAGGAGTRSLLSCAEPVPQLAPRGTPLRLAPDRLQAALAEGATLVVDGIEELHAPLRRLVAAVEKSLRCLVQANLYANLGGARQGFGTHWDDHDVLILQIEGAKHWEIHRPTMDFPVGVISEPPLPEPGTAHWSGELADGDVLYLPRGWWHRVSATDEVSAHLTVSARLPSAGDLLRRLMTRAAGEYAEIRQDLPRFAGPEDAGRWYAALREVLVKAVDTPGLLEQLAGELDTGAPARPVFALPDACPAGR
ncbi:cupin domain-containing protein [Kitasatospora sp. GP82]|uniref:cupin domain-containing protein n=1 Tax=Kitasatospora sp. GP82 TaxID=3035089 RepID=UPI0024755A84|nr:cupin domain-containing protein [Kitasatospora sp. GP82]MDH6125871.1 ribosomal protein L16 Arg81 hydroxylase [Kitasatospora sp. GP82]